MEDYMPMDRHMLAFQYKFTNEVYLMALKELGDKDKALTKANVWFNVHFLGCKYDPAIMEDLKKFNTPEFSQYLELRK
jgi:hypothetical protein